MNTARDEPAGTRSQCGQYGHRDASIKRKRHDRWSDAVVRHLMSVLVLWVALVMSAQAALPDYGKASLEALVDDLTAIDREAPGLSVMANYGGFFVDDRSPGFRSGVLGAPSVTVPPPMREVVRRGAAAVPILVEHLDDRRPTRLVVGGMIDQGGFFMWGYFGEEYDGRRWEDRVSQAAPDHAQMREKAIRDRYIVKVGDVCYALLGQIVGRSLYPVRYQPTGGLIINSPIESPVLAERAMTDWSGLTAAQHQASLIDDLARPSHFAAEGAS